MQNLDSRISKISKPTTTNSDDLAFKGKGNKVQFKFNSQRSSKLSEILECLQSRKYDSADDAIKSEISQIGQRNKIIKIADLGIVWQNVPLGDTQSRIQVEMPTVVGQFLTLFVDIGDEKGFHGLD
jgi:methylmalonyl-CoA mutase N-terminal domain/subunit